MYNHHELQAYQTAMVTPKGYGSHALGPHHTRLHFCTSQMKKIPTPFYTPLSPHYHSTIVDYKVLGASKRYQHHCMFQLGQLQGPIGSKKQLMGADSELLKSKFGPHEDQIRAELRGPLQRASEVGSSIIIFFRKAQDEPYRCYEDSVLRNKSKQT